MLFLNLLIIAKVFELLIMKNENTFSETLQNDKSLNRILWTIVPETTFSCFA